LPGSIENDRKGEGIIHNELKADMDIEKLPSGKFKTNALFLSLGTLA